MVSTLERGISPDVCVEVKNPIYFISAAELSLEVLQWIADVTGGSYQSTSQEGIVYFPFDGKGLVYSKEGGFKILYAGRGNQYKDYDHKGNNDKKISYPGATIAFNINGMVHITWPVQTNEIQYGFEGLTITSGSNTKQIEVHPLQNIQSDQTSVLFEAARRSYQKNLDLAA